jgi:hypothetical protein
VSLPLSDLVPPMLPLTVIRVERPISQDEAEAIHEQFRLAVKDDRPVLVIDTETSVTVLEPWQEASRRAWLAVVLAAVSLIIAITGMILLYLWTG